MPSLAQASLRQRQGGVKLPTAWDSWDRAGIHFRRGLLYMVVAAPNVGKTTLMTAYLARAQRRDPSFRALVLSMDQDPDTTCERAIASVTGWTVDEAEQRYAERDPDALEALGRLGGIHYMFPSSPDLREISERALALGESLGQFPDMIILDNLGNIEHDGAEAEGQRLLMRELQDLATGTGAAVVALHHAIGEYEDGDKCIPLSGVSNKLGKMPSMLLTLYQGWGAGVLNVYVAKNRQGPRGGVIPMIADYARNRVYEEDELR